MILFIWVMPVLAPIKISGLSIVASTKQSPIGISIFSEVALSSSFSISTESAEFGVGLIWSSREHSISGELAIEKGQRLSTKTMLRY